MLFISNYADRNMMFDFVYFKGWILDESERLKIEKSEVEKRLKEAKSEEKGKLEEELQRLTQYIQNADDLALSCDIR